MNKQMNKMFFSEFLALLSIKVTTFCFWELFFLFLLLQVNPDPYLRADPEIDIMKKEEEFPNGSAKFYDEEVLGLFSEKFPL